MTDFQDIQMEYMLNLEGPNIVLAEDLAKHRIHSKQVAKTSTHKLLIEVGNRWVITQDDMKEQYFYLLTLLKADDLERAMTQLADLADLSQVNGTSYEHKLELIRWTEMVKELKDEAAGANNA